MIENGYDEEAFEGLVNPAPTRSGPIKLVHSGLLYQDGREPSPFFKAIAALRAEGRVSAESLQVILRAPGHSSHIAAALAHYQLADIVRIAPPVPYREALAEMLGADILLVFQGSAFNTQVPAKIYEYFRARKPILALVDPCGETARVLAGSGFDTIVTMTDSIGIGRTLERLLQQIGAGQAHVVSDAVVAASSRAHRARQLAAVLDRVSGRSDTR